MMKRFAVIAVVSMEFLLAQAGEVVRPAVRGEWFREARFGMFIHWGIYSIPAKGEWSYAYDTYAPGEYEANAKKFNPVKYNPREWARLAKAAGMRYAVLTSRHHDGFCMFDSHFTDYKITKSPYGKDAVREFLEAFRAEGLKVGLYHSLPDWTHPGYADTESPECIRGGKKTPHVPTPEQYAAFTNLVYNHVNQLTTEYGKLDLLFLDYTSQTKADLDYFGRDRILEMVYRNQPDILVNDRLSYYKDNCRDFDYYTPEICVPNQPQTVKGREVMWETCATMNDHWGYCREDVNWKTPEAIVAGLVGCVSRNGNLLLNVGPTELGEIPEGSVKILKALADWQTVNGESVTGCGKSEFTPPYGCVYTQKGNNLYCHFLQSPLGDTILPQLKGKIEKATLLRTGEDIEQVNNWGFELLKPDEQRIRAWAIRPGDVIRIDLRKMNRSLEDMIGEKHKIAVSDEWGGGHRIIFEFNGRKAWIVEPNGGMPVDLGNRWVWTMQWMGAYLNRTGAPDLVKEGWRHVHLEAFDTRADDEGLKVLGDFQDYLVRELGFAPKANLIGLSWGGFYSIRYANAFPENVSRIYLDAPLLNFDGFGEDVTNTPTAAAAQIGSWAKSAPVDGDWSADPRMPVNMAEAVAKADIPVYLLYGGQDQTVNPKVNCERFAERFKAAGGDIRVEKRGLYGHHPHGFEHGDVLRIVKYLKSDNKED